MTENRLSVTGLVCHRSGGDRDTDCLSQVWSVTGLVVTENRLSVTGLVVTENRLSVTGLVCHRSGLSQVWSVTGLHWSWTADCLSQQVSKIRSGLSQQVSKIRYGVSQQDKV